MNLTETLKMLRNRGIEPTAVSYARFSSDNQREESIEPSKELSMNLPRHTTLILSTNMLTVRKALPAMLARNFKK